MRFKQTRRPTARPDGALIVSRAGAVNAPVAERPVKLIERLSRHVFESLESRIHLSVTRDANGYTVVTPAVDSRVVYIAADGNDANAGTINAPLKTVEGARAKLGIATAATAASGGNPRNSVPDQILFRRGDVFNDRFDNWATSGRSASEPFVIGAYTDPNRPSSERPKLQTGINTAFDNIATASVHPQLNNVYILGIAFEAHNRNYKQPNANFTIGYKSDASGGSYGINIYGAIDNFLVEDASFQYFRAGAVLQSVDGWGKLGNVTIRRSNISDNYAPSFDSTGKYITSEGIYANGVQTLTLDENVFDHNGWTDPAYGNFGTFATIYNHNIYLNIENTNVSVTNNIISNASSHGLQARAGGNVKNNLFINNPIGMSYGYLNGKEAPGGVSGEISGNVTYGSNRINTDPRGWGLEIGNLKPAANGGGTVVKNNIYANYDGTGTGALWPAIHLTYGSNSTNPEQGVGVNDLTIQNNIVYGWTKSVYINNGFAVGGTGRYAFNNVSFLNNEFQSIYASPMISHGPNYSAAEETWRGNRYNYSNNAASSTPFFATKSTTYSLTQWQALAEPTALNSKISYPNPSVSPGSFNGSIGGTSTIDAYLAQAKRQSKLFYRASYAPTTALNYMKAGFSGQRVDDQPPAAQLNATNINAGGGTTHTFTVTWNDDSQIDQARIGNGDVLVTGPNGYSQTATLLSATPSGDGSSVTAIYGIPAPGGAWSAAAAGTYTVAVRANEVFDTAGNATNAGSIGTFSVTIAAAAPTASLVTTNVSGANAAATLTVTYNVTSGLLDSNTIGVDDLQVFGPNGFSTTARFESATPAGNAATVVAVYKIDPPAGGWTTASNGVYEVIIRDDAVRSVGGVKIGEALLGTFNVGVAVPIATAEGTNVTNATTATQTVTVTYTDVTGIDAATIDNNDVRIDGPNGFTANATYVSKTGAGTPASPMVVTYSFQPPAGGFVEASNGTYFIVLKADQVLSSGGTAATAGPIGTFDVTIDFTAPSAVSTTASIFQASSSTSLPLTVVFSDPSGVNVSSIGTGDIVVELPGGGTAIPVFQSASGTGISVTATFILDMPAGIGAEAIGEYILRTGGNGVKDTVGNTTAAGQLAGSFSIALDLDAPTASAASDDIFSQYGELLVNVEYSDNPGIDITTIDNLDLRAVGPNGYNQPLEFVSGDFPEGNYAYVIYRLPPPADGWRFTDNGDYDIVMQANQVKDLSGNPVPTRVLDTFKVAVAAELSGIADPVTPNPAGRGLNEVTIRFNQVVTGFDINDVTLTRNGGGNLLTGSQQVVSTDGETFRIIGLSSLTQVDGDYVLTVPEGTSIVGEYGSGLGTSIILPFQIDATPPLFSLNAPNLTTANNSLYKFSVTWIDPNGVDTSKLGNGDVRVTGPNGYSVLAKLVSLDKSNSGTPRIATYSVTPPAIGWSQSINGDYTISVEANQVADVLGNDVAAQVLGVFNVNVVGQADITPPTVAVVAVSPNPRATPVDSITVNFNEVVEGFDLSDLTLTRDGGSNLLAGGQSLASGNNQSFTLNGLASVTATGGVYTLTLRSSGHGITDISGNNLGTGASTSWTVTIPPTVPPTVPASVAPSSGVNVNFQPAAAPNVSGYLIDSGALYGARNGQTYGWTIDHTSSVFDRNVISDQLRDTIVSVKAGGKWELAVPNGTYTVMVGIGDAGAASTNNVWVEGVNLFNYQPQSANTFDVKTVNATVTDGKLTVAIGNSGGGLVKLNFVQVYAPGSPPTSPPPTSPPPTSPPPPVFGVTGLQLVNADTDSVTGVVAAGQSIQVGSPGINLHAITTGTIGSVQFLVDGVQVRIEGSAPYSIGGDLAPDYLPWAAPIGTHVIKAIAYSGSDLSGTVGGSYEVSVTFVNPTSPPPTSPPPTSPPPPAVFGITGLQLVNADTDSVTGVVSAGQTIQVGSPNINLHAVTTGTIGSVQFLVDGVQVRMEASAPFSIGGDAAPDFLAWAAPTGTHTIKAIPYSGADLSGTAGTPYEVTVTFVNPTSPPPPPPPTATGVKINFQPASAPTVSGYLVDSGQVYAARNGQSYGWSANHADVVVDRNKNTDQLLDTNVPIKAGSRWDLAVPNGTYTLKMSVGDSGVSSKNNIWVEGTNWLYNNVSLAANKFSAKTATVQVTDGKLTLAIGSAATGATHINYVELTPVTTVPPTSPPPTSPPPPPPPPPATGTVKINFQPSAVATVSGYLVDAGLTYAARNGYTYGWTVSHVDAVFDRNKNSDQLLDTNVALKKDTSWELAVPNGTYTVKMSVGDSGGTSKNNIWLEGTNWFYNYVSLAANTFSTKTTTVQVSDGKLTVNIGGGATGLTHVNYIEVTGAGLAPASPPVAPVPVVLTDAGFESPSLPGNFQYQPTNPGWVFSTNAGVSGNGSGFTATNPVAPGGTQVAFLQQANATATQTTAGWQAGTYQLTFKAASRATNGGQLDFQVLVDGQVVGTFLPSTTSYQSYTTNNFTVTAGSHTIQFRGINTVGGDQTAFIDDVLVILAP